MRCLTLSSLLIATFCTLLAGAEKPVSFSAQQVAEAVKAAPAAPGLDELQEACGIRLQLVDFINFTDPNDIHDMRDRGTSQVVTGPAGSYRETAAHRHAMVSVRWRADAIDKPHLLLWEYPDDADRQICFFTHESGLSGRQNIDWSLETGVNCGYPLPLSNKMQYHTFFFWPSDQHPVAMYMNWARSGKPAAASRLWVYRVEGDHLPPLKVEAPDPENPRIFGGIHNWSLVPTKGIFGLNRSTVMDHIAEYHAFRGDNIISWPVVSNNSWGFRCKIPAWDGGEGRDTAELEQILAACEKHKIKFMPVFNVGIKFKMEDKTDKDADPAARKAAIEKGFQQFVDRYGKSPALYGIAFETQDLSPKYTECSLDQFRKSFGSLKKFQEFMKSIAPDLELYHYLGGKNIHDQYFHDGAAIFQRWESGQKAWSQHLADEVKALWTEWGRSPEEMADDGIHTVLSYQSDDYHIFDTYYQNPRAMTYWDLEASPERSALYDTRKAMIWNTFYEGYIGLSPVNWWYLKVWVAPDFNPAGKNTLAAWMQAMYHRDRDLLMFGAWNNKGAGHEMKMRKLAQAFRQLPPIELEDIFIRGNSPLKLRSGTYQGVQYFNVINHTPFAHDIAIGRHELTLMPFTMETLKIEKGNTRPRGEVSVHYVEWIQERFDRYSEALNTLRKMNPAAVPSAYEAHLKRAQEHFDAERYHTADQVLGFGIQHEMDLRLRLLEPPVITVPAAALSGELSLDLDAWPADAADWKTDASHIATHLFFPNFWGGDKDLSARLRAFHDDKHLYLGLVMQDQVLTAKDGCAFNFSEANYMKFADHSVKYEHSIPVPIAKNTETQQFSGAFGATGTTRRVEGGYAAVLTIPLDKMPLQDKTIGFVLSASDDDATKYLNKAGWARKQALLFPHHPTFAYWSDARTCIQMKLE